MSIATNFMVALIRENKPQKFLEIDTKYLNKDKDLPVYDFIVKYFSDYGSLPPEGLVVARFGLEPVEGQSQYWEDSLSKLRFSLIFENSISKISDIVAKGETVKAKEQLLQMITELDSKRGLSGEFTREEGLNAVLSSIPSNRAVGGLLGTPTGWNTLDEITHGWCRGGVYVISARMKMGKTMLLCHSAEMAYMSGARVLFVSMEMNKNEFFTRVLGLQTNLSPNNLFYGQVSFFTERRIQQLVDSDIRKKDYIFQEGLFKTGIHELGFLIQMRKPDIVFIDGAYLLRVPGSNKMPSWERATEVITLLKTFSAQYDVPIVCTYQLNREAAKRGHVGPEHIHLSDAIPQIATTAIGIFDTDMEDEKIMRVLANRNGPTGDITINWLWDTSNFSEVNGTIDNRQRIDMTDPIQEENPDPDLIRTP